MKISTSKSTQQGGVGNGKKGQAMGVSANNTQRTGPDKIKNLAGTGKKTTGAVNSNNSPAVGKKPMGKKKM